MLGGERRILRCRTQVPTPPDPESEIFGSKSPQYHRKIVGQKNWAILAQSSSCPGSPISPRQPQPGHHPSVWVLTPVGPHREGTGNKRALRGGGGARVCLFLVPLGLELGLADGGAAQLDVELALEGVEDLLVGGGGAVLELGQDVGGGVAGLSELVAGHGGLEGRALLLDQLADLNADRLGLNDVRVVVERLLALAFGIALGLKKRGVVLV